jgi:hypothetical protein
MKHDASVRERGVSAATAEAGRRALSEQRVLSDSAVLRKKIEDLEFDVEILDKGRSILADKLNAERKNAAKLQEMLDNSASKLNAEKETSAEAADARDEALGYAARARDAGFRAGKEAAEAEIEELRAKAGMPADTLRNTPETDAVGGGETVRWFAKTCFHSKLLTADRYIPLADMKFQKIVLKPTECGGVECGNNLIMIPGFESIHCFAGDRDLRAAAMADGRIEIYMEE